MGRDSHPTDCEASTQEKGYRDMELVDTLPRPHPPLPPEGGGGGEGYGGDAPHL